MSDTASSVIVMLNKLVNKRDAGDARWQGAFGQSGK